MLCSGFCAIHVLYVLPFQFVKPMKTVLLDPFSHHSCKLSTSSCSTSSWSTCSLHSLSRYLGILLQKELMYVLPTLHKRFSLKMPQQEHIDSGGSTLSARGVSPTEERMVLARWCKERDSKKTDKLFCYLKRICESRQLQLAKPPTSINL